MHELSLCQALLDQASQIAVQHGANTIISITVQVGPLSGVEPRLLARAFEIARGGTLASQAALTVKASEILAKCTACAARTSPPANRLRCASCGDFRVTIIDGQELVLASLELDVLEANHVH